LPHYRVFDWDCGNKDKNWLNHKVSQNEAEEVFTNEPIIMVHDNKHSVEEARYLVLGKTNTNRKLSIIVTFRKDRIRVISARDMSIKERRLYGQERKRYTTV
jgi:hypothetical protein